MAKERWNDPFPPEMFAPTDEEIANIVNAVQSDGFNAVRRRPRKRFNTRAMGSLAAIAVLIIGVTVAGRSMQYLWGEKVLPNGGSTQSHSGTSQDSQLKIADRQAAPADEADGATDSEAGDVTNSAGNVASDADSAIEPQSAPMQAAATAVPESRTDTMASRDEDAEKRMALSDENSSQATQNVRSSDAIVAGFIKAGTLTVNEVLYGSCDAMVAIGIEQEGMAFVLLQKDGTFQPLPTGPCVFLVHDGTTLVLNATGDVLEVNDDLTADVLRESLTALR
jgi:hypothetical protein